MPRDEAEPEGMGESGAHPENAAVRRIARMGARVELAADQTPLGYSAARVLTQNAAGRMVERVVPEPPGSVLAIVHFVELDDGSRVTTEEFGEMTLHMSLIDCSEAELRAEVREFVYEDDMREIPELADGPRWADMQTVLRRHGINIDEQALAALPFTVDVDRRVRGLLAPD